MSNIFDINLNKKNITSKLPMWLCHNMTYALFNDYEECLVGKHNIKLL